MTPKVHVRKLFIESIPVPFSSIICDKFLWWFNNILPKSLPKELQQLVTWLRTLGLAAVHARSPAV